MDLAQEVDMLAKERRDRRVRDVLVAAGIFSSEFDKFYDGEYQRLGFVKSVEILTYCVNPDAMNLFARRNFLTNKRQCLLLAAYIKGGGDPEYFTSGSGAPGNCTVM